MKHFLYTISLLTLALTGCESDKDYAKPQFREGDKVIIVVNDKPAFITDVYEYHTFVKYGIQYSDNFGKLQSDSVKEFELRSEATYRAKARE